MEERGCVEMKIYPVCAKDWLKDEVDSDPEAVARAMGIAIIDIPED